MFCILKTGINWLFLQMAVQSDILRGDRDVLVQDDEKGEKLLKEIKEEITACNMESVCKRRDMDIEIYVKRLVVELGIENHK